MPLAFIDTLVKRTQLCEERGQNDKFVIQITADLFSMPIARVGKQERKLVNIYVYVI